jgi:hypothetical protein
MDIKDLKDAAIKFIDNGGGIGNASENGSPGKACDYCQGERSPSSSDHPNKAIISVQSDRGTEYGTYIQVQNELLRAYTILRNRLAKQKFQMSFDELEKAYDEAKKNAGLKDRADDLKLKVEFIRTSYPQIISDAEPTS